MTKRSFLAAALLVVAAAAALECKRANGAYCDDSRPCPSGFACDLTARECHSATVGGGDMAGGSTDMAGCTCSGATPICVAMTCVSCLSSSDPEGACAAASPSTPHCLTTEGSCVACRDNNDCSSPTPFCDANAHFCRGCIADAECPSLICELTPGSVNHGICVAPSNVVYADAVNGNDAGGNDGLTTAKAFKTIQKAINTAVGLNPVRGFVRAAAGTYPDFFGVNNKTIYVVGADGTFIHVTMAGKDAVGSAGASGSLTLRNMTVEADSGNAGNCTMGSFAAYQVKFINSSQVGIQSTACAPLVLDGCTISGNMQGGIYVVSGDFTIVNTVIAKNIGPGLYQAAASANTVFVNNTVADNTVGVGGYGVRCFDSTLAPVNTIFWHNTSVGTTISETNCTGSFDANDDPGMGPGSTVDLSSQAPGFVSGSDYHLVAGSPCLDHGSSMLGAPNHDADFNRRPDAKTMKVDLGAYELQQ